MTDEPVQASEVNVVSEVTKVVPPDDLVEQTLQKAADKVAAATSTPNGTPGLNRMEAIVAISVLVILNLANLFVTIDNRSDLKEHKQDFKAMCESFVQLSPEETAKELAVRLADCLKD